MDKKQRNKNAKNSKNNKKNIKKNNKNKKMKTWKKVLIIIALILLILGGIFTYRVYLNGGGMSGVLATVVGHDENTKKNLGEFRALVLGISTDQEGVELTDTIIVASYNPNTQKATLLSIPRDTFVGKNSSRATSYEKINSLYSRKSRPDETLEAVNELTGLNIEYYVVVKTEALIKLVDVIGGVNFNVPINMDYDDTSQNLHIHLKAGEQLLDGDKAEQLVRFRHNNNGTSYPEEYGDNDTGRMRTQREFITQVLKQTLKPENIFKIGEILDVAKEYVITNVDINYAKDYVPYAVEFNTQDITTGILPGENTNKNSSGTWIFLPNKTQTAQLIQELFYDRDLVEEQNTTDATTEEEATSKVSKANVNLEVLNGSGITSNLEKVVNELENVGYKVTRTGETNVTSKTTIVNKKEASDAILKNIKDTIKIGNISTSQSSSSKVDITVIIGKDFQ